MSVSTTVTLRTGVVSPRLAFGTWRIKEAPADAVCSALKLGYRAIDTACAYGNEEGVGEGIRRSGIPRDELFLATKMRNSDQGYLSGLRAFDASEQRLGTRIDQYLLHWPCPARGNYVDAWRALEKLYADGRVRSVGVCNFNIPHLETLRQKCDLMPMVNQIEMHPMLIQPELLEYCAAHGIQVEAYSPLMHGGAVLEHPLMLELAQKYGRTVSQITLRSLIQQGAKVLVKSVHENRMLENMQIYDFSLSEEDMAKIATLNARIRTCGDPDTMNLG